ncbi:MAG: biosynthetic-type acetolactate synthase large subunit [Bacteroidales bacterium]|jgi:acetolactate synthase-1/2/3 large subunit|nr:biosynthetic-type acetolactate synthase large subunit [Bacteroidales bacterium]MDD4640989.1 biosynthetic-type acetolactate synthase large subunit [Bacteroidales bacterium]
MEKKKMTGAEALLFAFREEKVNTIFGYPGGAIIPVFDALYTHKEKLAFNHILTRHEQGAAHAAQGYARVSGKVGVVIVTSGPAAANIVTGVADAMLDSTPLVVVTGQTGVAALGSDAFQETDVLGITQAVTKWSYQIRRAEDIPWVVARAFYIAREGRPGPVVLDLSKDAQNQLMDFQYEKCRYIRSYQPEPKLRNDKIAQAAQLINQAKKPFAVIGQGVLLGQAEQELFDFLNKADIPAASTLLGLAVMPVDYRLNMGMVGMHGNLAPNKKTNECDVLIAIGMRFSDRVTGKLSEYAPQAKVIHFDIDPSEINKNVKVEVGVLGNVKKSLPAVTELLNPASHKEWIDSFEEHKRCEYDEVVRKDLHPENGILTMAEVVKSLSDNTGEQTIVVTDVGQNQITAARYFSAYNTRKIVTSGGLGTMGFGLPAGIGAALGCPESKVCVVSGDGGIQMTIQELGTIMEHKIPVKIIILNNNYLGMVRQWQELFYEERYSSTSIQNPDFVALAAAYGIKGRKVEQRQDLDKAVREMVACDSAFVLEVMVEKKGIVYPMVPAGKCITDVMLKS